jgi:hypothetical protein
VSSGSFGGAFGCHHALHDTAEYRVSQALIPPLPAR